MELVRTGLSITLWPRTAQLKPRSEPAGFIGDIIKSAEKDLGRRVSWSWIVNDQPIDVIFENDCKVVAGWLRGRAESLGGDSVRSERGFDDPESLEETAEFFERSGGILITA